MNNATLICALVVILQCLPSAAESALAEQPDPSSTAAGAIQSATIPPGEEQTLKVAIPRQSSKLLELAFHGMRGTPGG